MSPLGVFGIAACFGMAALAVVHTVEHGHEGSFEGHLEVAHHHAAALVDHPAHHGERVYVFP